MKIIRNNTMVDKTRRCECTNCGSVLEVGRSDLTFVADSRDGNAYTFDCPVCAHKNWIAASLIDVRKSRIT